MLFREDMIALISMLEVLLFLLPIRTFILNHLDLNIHATIEKITLRIMLGSIPHRNSFFIIYLLKDEQELSLRMLDTSPMYL